MLHRRHLLYLLPPVLVVQGGRLVFSIMFGRRSATGVVEGRVHVELFGGPLDGHTDWLVSPSSLMYVDRDSGQPYRVPNLGLHAYRRTPTRDQFGRLAWTYSHTCGGRVAA